MRCSRIDSKAARMHVNRLSAAGDVRGAPATPNALVALKRKGYLGKTPGEGGPRLASDRNVLIQLVRRRKKTAARLPKPFCRATEFEAPSRCRWCTNASPPAGTPPPTRRSNARARCKLLARRYRNYDEPSRAAVTACKRDRSVREAPSTTPFWHSPFREIRAGSFIHPAGY